MTVKRSALLLAMFMLAVLAAGLWYRNRAPERVVATGTVVVRSETGPGNPITLRTRTVMVASTRFEQVELPGGNWIDCGSDCARVAREAGPDFWEKIRRESGGR
jgi:hypothetical protein